MFSFLLNQASQLSKTIFFPCTKLEREIANIDIWKFLSLDHSQKISIKSQSISLDLNITCDHFELLIINSLTIRFNRCQNEQQNLAFIFLCFAYLRFCNNPWRWSHSRLRQCYEYKWQVNIFLPFFPRNNFSHRFFYLFAVALSVVGLLFLLFGLRMFKIVVFLIGFAIVFALVFLITSVTRARYSDAIVRLIVSFLFGIGGGYLALFCQKVVVFLVGFAFGFIALAGLALSTQGSHSDSLVIYFFSRKWV